MDPRIEQWFIEEKEKGIADRDKKIQQAGEVMRLSRIALVNLLFWNDSISEISDEWQNTARAALDASSELRKIIESPITFIDLSLEPLSLMNENSILCIPDHWAEKHLIEENKLQQLLDEGILRGMDTSLQFSCSVRLGGYKYQDIKKVKDEKEDFRFIDTCEIPKKLNVSDMQLFGNFEKERKRALELVEVKNIYDQGEEWDTVSRASAWAEIYVSLYFGPKSFLWK
jgi:hypothetical protein